MGGRGTFVATHPLSVGTRAALGILLLILALLPASAGTAATPGERQHLIFWKGTPQELEVFRIYGRQPGPTVMIMGGIQGDEPGGFLSAELYADLSLKKGNLIVVPRANFRSVVQNNRGPSGDMNRKFEDDLPPEPEINVVDILKSLMAESDLLLNLHDGSGFYRPVWESEQANPKRYGQCIIADSASYVHTPSGRILDLKTPAEAVIARLNRDIGEPLHKFHFFNMETVREDTQYLEQRKSATYYALTRLGIPAFGVETSKQLPSLEMKIRQHVVAVDAFLDIFGVELERPGIALDKPVLGYVIIAVNNAPPVAAAAGQTLLVAPGDVLEVLHASANYERGLSVEIQGLDGLNDLNRPVRIEKPTTIVVRRDSTPIGEIAVALLPENEKTLSPRLTGENRARPPRQATPATLDMLPGTRIIAEAKAAAAHPGGPSGGQGGAEGAVTGFLIEVDGKPVEVPPGGQIEVVRGAKVKIVDLKTAGGDLPKGVVMNLRGFVPKEHAAGNTGEDRGHTADTGKDMQPAFSEGRKGEIYAINAELGKQVLASCSLRIVQPKPAFASVSLRWQDKTRALAFGSRVIIPVGAKVELLDVSLPDAASSAKLRFTLAGHPLPAKVPQTLTMRDIAINLAVFNGDVLIGKITWVPGK